MVFLLNGCLSDGNSSKRPLENGCFLSSSVSEFKYEPRKVSCIRDYPPGCGRNALLINSRQKENVVELVGDKDNLVDEERTEVVVDDCVGTPEFQVEIQSHEVLKSRIWPEMAESSSGLVGKVVDMPWMVSDDDKISTNMEVLRVGSRKGLESLAPELLEELLDVEVQPLVKREDAPEKETVSIAGAKKLSSQQWSIANVSEEIVLKRNYLRRSVSVTRDYPPFCGRDATCPNEEECRRVLLRNKSFGGTERGGAKGRPLRETVGAPCPNEEERQRVLLRNKSFGGTERAGAKDRPLKETLGAARASVIESKRNVRDGNAQKNELRGTVAEPRNKSRAVIKKDSKDVRDSLRKVPKEIMVQSHEKSPKRRLLGDHVGEDRMTGQGLMASPYCLWQHGKRALKTMPHGGMSTLKKQDSGLHDFDVRLPGCYVPSSSNSGDARSKVRETLYFFQTICRKLLRMEEAKLRQSKRIDLEAIEIVKKKGKELNTGKQILGAVPGVEVGDEFHYRVELVLVGVHRHYQSGIDYMKYGGEIIAISVVASGGYDDDLDNADVLIYSGQGGNPGGRDKQSEDQKLVRGNLALKNSILVKNAVRVIHGSRETKASDSLDARAKMVMTYTYNGLYIVKRYWKEPGPHGNLVYKFELTRLPGQPELSWKEVKNSKKYKIRKGFCVDDISGGKELFRICAVNSIDNEKPLPFKYRTKMKYPDWYHPNPPKGCDCTNGCSDPENCLCAVKNGGMIPYNHNGAIVEVNPLVYECGPSCKCPPSCCNRVSQHGIKIPLEIFKTEARGWGVRSLTSIPSGSFICEYTGELLGDKEADQRTGGYDEYLFYIGQNYNDCSPNDQTQTLKPDAQSNFCEVEENVGYTIDAAQYGNVGRFINHSCSPNLYAQNVLYDHDDKRMPHIMLFAAGNIPPLQELSYQYNCMVNQIRDSNGNIKMKRCYCGSTVCTGRMY